MWPPPGRPDQGLPEPQPSAVPQAYDIGDEPTEPPSEGEWIVAVYMGRAAWVFVPQGDEAPDQGLPGPQPGPDQGLPGEQGPTVTPH